MSKEIQVPQRLAGRPRHNGFVIPYFVAFFKEGRQCHEKVEGAVPSFPTTDYSRLLICRKQNRCWICGQGLGAFKAFVFGPASALARSSYEPPSHRDCARYAMQVCPYLTNPNHQHTASQDSYKLKPDERVLPDVLPDNPGVSVMWVTRHYTVEVRDASRGICIFIPGEPEFVELWSRARKATYKEAADAIQHAIRKNRMLDNQANVRELAWRVQQLLAFAGEPDAIVA